MWNYKKLTSSNSPMAEILARCSCKENILLVIYHLSENHVECATTPHVDKLRLGDACRTIKADSRNNHAILAYDLGTNEGYKIEDVPELPIASAVLLCVVTELLNGCVQPRESQYGIPKARMETTPRPMPSPRPMSSNRDERGRFVSQGYCEKNDEAPNLVAPISGHRFRLGRHL
jgi:hypothetical protein